MEIDDDYDHVVEGVFYTPQSIPSGLIETDDDSIRIHKEFNSQNESCRCRGQCVNGDCACITKLGPNGSTNYAKTEHGYALRSDRPIYECNSECGCDVDCGNRLVQFGPRKTLKVIPTEKKGFGVIATDFIPKGGFVCEYAGEILTLSEAKERDLRNRTDGKMNYVICLNEHCGSNKIQTFIDPSVFGNIGRYLNHSCDPNCEIAAVRVESPIPKLCLFANRDINRGEELHFDYSPSAVAGDVQCFCGAAPCKGWLPAQEYHK